MSYFSFSIYKALRKVFLIRGLITFFIFFYPPEVFDICERFHMIKVSVNTSISFSWPL